MPQKSLIHTRQIILALLTTQSLIAVILFIQQILTPTPTTRPFAIGFIALVWAGLLLAYWRGWEYSRQVNVLVTTLFVAFALQEPFVSEILPVTIMLPPIIALIMAEPKWVFSSMIIQVIILIVRAGGSGIYTDPAALAVLGILTGGLLLGRYVMDQARQTAVAHATATEQQAEQLRFQAHLLTAVEQPIIAIGRGGHITYWNQAAAALFNIPADEALACHITELADVPFSQEIVTEMWERWQNGKVERGEYTTKQDNGSLLHLLIGESIVYDTHHELSGFVLICTDLTEYKKIQTRLVQGQKMESIGRLAGGIAHDFNNLLTVILTSTELLSRRSDGTQPMLQKYTSQIGQAARQAADLTSQLLAFSRKQMRQPRVIDLNELVLTMHHLLIRLIGDNIILTTHSHPTVCPIQADPTQMKQVIMNLAANARDAMLDGGQLTIETNIISLEVEMAGLKPGTYVTLVVSDTGVGMDSETLKHLFEPFYTTKALGQGTGLGLATVYGIIEQSGGECRVYSEPNFGTSFKIYLPLAQEQAIPLSPTPVKPQISSGTETILVVENADSIRDLVNDVLQEEGYTVVMAANGEEALQLSQKYPHLIHLLLTDVIMPGMSGDVLAQNLKEIHPQTKVLYMSGYTDNVITRHGILQPGTAFLEKPFAPYNLLQAIRNVLDKEQEDIWSLN